MMAKIPVPSDLRAKMLILPQYKAQIDNGE